MQLFLFLGVAALCSIISLIRHRRESTPLAVVETILFYLLVVNVGLSGLMAFCGHVFLADRVATSIGWPTGNPFQSEVAVANLAFGVLGLLCIRFRDGFWLATGLGYATFLLGAAFIHIREILVAGNHAINNAGPILYIGDIAMPIVILSLLLARGRLQRPGEAAATPFHV